ncbi:hypothetical protein SHKM778_02350 [Streptomyces sp. KM77-8]|uniref:Major facilitator superfamily (MFS) profile domain-containing protein n=1 Tax=Streptomyces haneummycinicus TaxID=3074435 RepID=A0AAT9H8Y8_9ACTN
MPDVRLSSPQGKWILLTTVLGSSMALLDSTVVNVALPRIGRDLDADLGALQWTVNAYMVTLAGLILLGGALGDRFGRRKVFVVGVLWFAAASLLCGLAPNAGMLIAARALQGVGGALLTPARSLSSRRPSTPTTGAARSACGPASAVSARPSDRSSAAGWWTGPAGAGCSSSTCPSPCCAPPSPYGTCRSRRA